MAYLWLVGGFAILIVGGDLLVRGGTAMALRLGIPTLIVGLTVVATGTSAPELVVSMRAALAGSPGIAVGNVVGSNIANILLVLGLPAMIRSTDCCEPGLRRNTVFMIGATLVFIGLCYSGTIGFWQGALLFGLVTMFLLESARHAGACMAICRDEKPSACPPSTSNAPSAPSAPSAEQALEGFDGVEGMPHTWKMISGFLLAGLVALPIGAHLVVESATEISRAFGVSEAVIGLTVVALGTSLPELATTLAAAYRAQGALAIGNVLGSNMFNLLAIMGLTAMVTPLAIPEQVFRVDLWIMLAAALIIVPFAFFAKPITRLPATLMVGAYVVYIVMTLQFGGKTLIALLTT
ncbi:MAG: calcium/sodium antiporter [Alphaproteobacteria bacterium]